LHSYPITFFGKLEFIVESRTFISNDDEKIVSGLFTEKTSSTAKPFMFVCPLFCKFRELNKTVKLKAVNIDTVATSIGITHVLELCGLNSPK